LYEGNKEIDQQMGIKYLVESKDKEIYKSKQMYNEMVVEKVKQALKKKKYSNIKGTQSQCIQIQNRSNIKRKRNEGDLFNMFGELEEVD